MSVETLFFDLLQVAIGTRKSLSVTPSADEWTELFALSQKQALVGIAFAGIKKLPAEQLPSVEIISQFVFYAAKIQQRNKELNEECTKVCHEFAHDGMRSVVLKGQSNLMYYPEELRECRTPGDIDLWCDVPEGVEVVHEVNGAIVKRVYRGMEGVIEYCKQYERCQGREIPWHRVLYYHCELTSPSGIGIEPHYRPSYLNSPLRNWRLQMWFRENEQFQTLSSSPCVGREPGSNGSSSSSGSSIPLSRGNEGVFPIPTASFNAVYQLLHIYKHLFEEGIGLRQLLDYYFVLRTFKESSQMTKEEIMHTLSRFGMRKFASATMYVLQTVFEAPLNPPEGGKLENTNWQTKYPWMICEPNEKEGKFLLNEIMQAGNFGKYDTRISHSTSQMGHAWEKLKHNFRLIHHYPEEVMWEPIFRVYHWVWRKLELWRW